MVSVKFLSKLKERYSTGLDIGTSAIKLVKLKFANDSPELIGLASEQVGGDPEGALKKLVQEHDLKKVNISVSGQSALIRYANFPRMSVEEFRQALRFEAQKHIPFSVSEVNLDGAILRPDLPDNKMLVLLAAVKKDFIAQRLKFAEGAGLTVTGIDIDSVALINAFDYNAVASSEELKTRAIALLNIGATLSNLDILEAGTPRLSRDIQVAGNNITQKIAEICGVNLKAAEALKLETPADKLNVVTQARESVFAALAGELRTSFDYYESQSTSSVSKIFLSGSGSLCEGLKERLGALLGIEVDYWDPLEKINAEASKKPGSAFAVAFGLALRR